MAWIDTVSYDDAEGRLRKLYDRVKGPDDNVDNIMMTHSLRPHTMEGHMALYKSVLHHGANTVPKWFLETIGVWVSPRDLPRSAPRSIRAESNPAPSRTRKSARSVTSRP